MIRYVVSQISRTLSCQDTRYKALYYYSLEKGKIQVFTKKYE